MPKYLKPPELSLNLGKRFISCFELQSCKGVTLYCTVSCPNMYLYSSYCNTNRAIASVPILPLQKKTDGLKHIKEAKNVTKEPHNKAV